MAADQVPQQRAAGFPKHARLLKHSDFQRVYEEARKSFSGNVTALYRVRTESDGFGPRVGFAVGKALGGAVVRNRIKRRMRAAVSKHLGTVNCPVDIVLHPRKSVLQLDFAKLNGEIQQLFAAVQKGARP
ncbi:MAG TPA: ribonuclease P protein component [Candidatus Angelobacter sp.]|nr:ribonuclease P protein component [Candidatus Angelobacter sp.]